MTGLQLFHTILFIIFGVVILFEVRSVRKPQRYVRLAIGILALLIALYDILVSGLGIKIF